jgi:hypothetical protein
VELNLVVQLIGRNATYGIQSSKNLYLNHHFAPPAIIPIFYLIFFREKLWLFSGHRSAEGETSAHKFQQLEA